ncbi:hypothetical protein BDN72DRAFT_837829 [Pluteus cervinus]|uniref:Uncharacterized protein n=1 Tax=Pluteus cervinus TaxID=181527 RepID=A0ACD3AZS0_9AGAR|nr:hypothetical protein BDN72DRAFT_837829 [Pluteus cervinus]
MFKRSKLLYSDTPSAPKLGLLSLPAESPSSTPVYERKPMSIMKGVYPERRSQTPIPTTATKTRHEPSSRESSSRQRTVSMTNDAPLKSILKNSHKSSSPPLVSCLKTGSSPPTSAGHEKGAGSYAGYVKGGGSSSHYTSASHTKQMERTSSSKGDQSCWSNTRSNTPAPPPPYDHSRSRRSSVSKHQDPSRSPTNSSDTPKYMKAYVKQVPLKAEAVALSWPLVDYASRNRSEYPPLYFDVWFDPKGSDWGVREHRGGYSTPLPHSTWDIPVSSHCILTEMVIVSRHLEQWPVVVRKPTGLRCGDILEAIYHNYQKPLTREEQRQIGHDYLERCRKAFQLRCKESPGLPAYNEKCGLRRVDLLRGKRIFKGLTQKFDTPGQWLLEFHEPRSS